jgi:hypothetical protein
MGVAPLATSAISSASHTDAYVLTTDSSTLPGLPDLGSFDISQITDDLKLLLTDPSQAIESVDGLGQFFAPNTLTLLDLLAVGKLSDTLGDPQAFIDSLSNLFTSNTDGWIPPVLGDLNGGNADDLLKLLDPLGLLSGDNSDLLKLLDPLGLLSGDNSDLLKLLDPLGLLNSGDDGGLLSGLGDLFDPSKLTDLLGGDFSDLGSLLDPLGLLSGDGNLGDLSNIFDLSWLTSLLGS